MHFFQQALRRLIFLLSPLVLAGSAYGLETQLAITDLHRLHLSEDAGATWTSLDILPDLNRTTYLLAAARSPANPDQIAVGTSFEGIYESLDRGATWKKLEALKSFRPYFQGAGFYEEVVALQYAADGSNDLYFRLGNSGKIFRHPRGKKTATELDPAGIGPLNLGPGFRYPIEPDSQLISWNYTLPPQALPPSLPADYYKPEPNLAIDPTLDLERSRRRAAAANRFGLYLNANQVQPNKLDQQLAFVKKHKLNSIVIDFKDEMGRLTYDSQVPLAREMKAQSDRTKPAEIIRKAHEQGIYVIARIVVFKDKSLYAYKNHAYAIWDRFSNKPWGVFRKEETPPATAGGKPGSQWVQIEHWVDPYSDMVHQYAISIAKEAQAMGADEIQFDYIRFPSDGETNRIQCRHNTEPEASPGTASDTQRVLALTSFLRKAREALTIPIGTDVFGFNGWARMSYLGQDIQAFSYYVDVISPMMYPSHYALDFLNTMRYTERASAIYEMGTQRARAMTGNRCLIRPYVQAFLIGGERKWPDPQFIEYLNRQVESSLKGGASGMTMWNNSGNYYMVETKSFTKLIPDYAPVGAKAQD